MATAMATSRESATVRAQPRDLTHVSGGAAFAKRRAAMATHSTLAPAFNAAVGLGDYVRHRPEDTVLYEIVGAHLDEFLDAASERERPLPKYVAEEFRKYACGR